MKTLQVVTFLLLTSKLIGQIEINDLKGEWVVDKLQATSGPNDTIMMIISTNTSQYHDLTLFIDQKIHLLKGDQTIHRIHPPPSQGDCDFKIKEIEIIEDVNQFLFNTYMVRPIQLGLDKDKERMLIITTECEDEMLDKIYYFNKDRIGLHKLATFFIFKRK